MLFACRGRGERRTLRFVMTPEKGCVAASRLGDTNPLLVAVFPSSIIYLQKGDTGELF